MYNKSEQVHIKIYEKKNPNKQQFLLNINRTKAHTSLHKCWSLTMVF